MSSRCYGKARIEAPQVVEAAGEETGPDQEEERERHLGHHQPLAEAYVAASRNRSRFFLQGGGELGTRGLPGRHQAEHETGGQGHREGEEEHPAVGGRTQAAAGLLEGQGAEQGVADPHRQQEAGRTAQAGEEQALHEKLTHDVAAPRAEGEAHRNLAFA